VGATEDDLDIVTIENILVRILMYLAKTYHEYFEKLSGE
jgi:hypothetical protein